MAKDRIGGFHQEAAARQVARQAQPDDPARRRVVGTFFRWLPRWWVRFIERPAQAATGQASVKVLDWLSQMTRSKQEA